MFTLDCSFYVNFFFLFYVFSLDLQVNKEKSNDSLEIVAQDASRDQIKIVIDL